MAEEERFRGEAEGLNEERDQHRQLVAGAVDPDLGIRDIRRKQVFHQHAVRCFVGHAREARHQ